MATRSMSRKLKKPTTLPTSQQSDVQISGPELVKTTYNLDKLQRSKTTIYPQQQYQNEEDELKRHRKRGKRKEGGADEDDKMFFFRSEQSHPSGVMGDLLDSDDDGDDEGHESDHHYRNQQNYNNHNHNHNRNNDNYYHQSNGRHQIDRTNRYEDTNGYYKNGYDRNQDHFQEPYQRSNTQQFARNIDTSDKADLLADLMDDIDDQLKQTSILPQSPTSLRSPNSARSGGDDYSPTERKLIEQDRERMAEFPIKSTNVVPKHTKRYPPQVSRGNFDDPTQSHNYNNQISSNRGYESDSNDNYNNSIKMNGKAKHYPPQTNTYDRLDRGYESDSNRSIKPNRSFNQSQHQQQPHQQHQRHRHDQQQQHARDVNDAYRGYESDSNQRGNFKMPPRGHHYKEQDQRTRRDKGSNYDGGYESDSRYRPTAPRYPDSMNERAYEDSGYKSDVPDRQRVDQQPKYRDDVYNDYESDSYRPKIPPKPSATRQNQNDYERNHRSERDIGPKYQGDERNERYRGDRGYESDTYNGYRDTQSRDDRRPLYNLQSEKEPFGNNERQNEDKGDYSFQNRSMKDTQGQKFFGRSNMGNRYSRTDDGGYESDYLPRLRPQNTGESAQKQNPSRNQPSKLDKMFGESPYSSPTFPTQDKNQTSYGYSNRAYESNKSNQNLKEPFLAERTRENYEPSRPLTSRQPQNNQYDENNYNQSSPRDNFDIAFNDTPRSPQVSKENQNQVNGSSKSKQTKSSKAQDSSYESYFSPLSPAQLSKEPIGKAPVRPPREYTTNIDKDTDDVYNESSHLRRSRSRSRPRYDEQEPYIYGTPSNSKPDLNRASSYATGYESDGSRSNKSRRKVSQGTESVKSSSNAKSEKGGLTGFFSRKFKGDSSPTEATKGAKDFHGSEKELYMLTKSYQDQQKKDKSRKKISGSSTRSGGGITFENHPVPSIPQEYMSQHPPYIDNRDSYGSNSYNLPNGGMNYIEQSRKSSLSASRRSSDAQLPSRKNDLIYQTRPQAEPYLRSNDGTDYDRDNKLSHIPSNYSPDHSRGDYYGHRRHHSSQNIDYNFAKNQNAHNSYNSYNSFGSAEPKVFDPIGPVNPHERREIPEEFSKERSRSYSDTPPADLYISPIEQNRDIHDIPEENNLSEEDITNSANPRNKRRDVEAIYGANDYAALKAQSHSSNNDRSKPVEEPTSLLHSITSTLRRRDSTASSLYELPEAYEEKAVTRDIHDHLEAKEVGRYKANEYIRDFKESNPGVKNR